MAPTDWKKSYQSTLAGVDGRTITQRNAYGNAIADENATTFAAKDGSNLVLSLDVNVQEIVERYLNEAIAANTVENRGCAIVMNVKTGAILAMASKPDFDPNDPLDYSCQLDYLNELVHAEPELCTASTKRMRTATSSRMQTATAFWTRKGLLRLLPRYPVEEQDHHRSVLPRQCVQGDHLGHGRGLGLANHQHHLYLRRCYGVAKETYHCAGTKAHGTIIWPRPCARAAISTISSWASALAPRPFYNYFDAFGFTSRTGVDLPSETGFMQYYKANQLGEVQLASSAFGQAMAITPLQVHRLGGSRQRRLSGHAPCGG